MAPSLGDNRVMPIVSAIVWIWACVCADALRFLASIMGRAFPVTLIFSTLTGDAGFAVLCHAGDRAPTGNQRLSRTERAWAAKRRIVS